LVQFEAQNQSLTRAKDRYLALYDDNPTMVFNLSECGLILSVNRTGAKQLGLAVEELQDCSILDFIHPDDLPIIHALFESCLASPFFVHKQELRQVVIMDGLFGLGQPLNYLKMNTSKIVYYWFVKT